MEDKEKRAIESFGFFNEGDYITREMAESKDIVLRLIQKQQAEINAVQMEHNHDVKMIDEVKGEAVRLYKEIDKLKRQIQIKDKYLELMWFLGADYDGWNTVDGLMSLIDNIMDYVKKAGKNDDKYAVCEGGNGKYFNILCEEVEKEGNENE